MPHLLSLGCTCCSGGTRSVQLLPQITGFWWQPQHSFAVFLNPLLKAMTSSWNAPWFFNLTQRAAWVLNLSEFHSKLFTVVPRALALEKWNEAEVLHVEGGEVTQEMQAEDSFFSYSLQHPQCPGSCAAHWRKFYSRCFCNKRGIVYSPSGSLKLFPSVQKGGIHFCTSSSGFSSLYISQQICD